MSPRFIRVTVILTIVAALFAAAYLLLPQINRIHRKIDTAGKIVYLSDADPEGKPQVWIIKQDGTGAKDLTPGTQTCADPVFSPDGSQIAYVSDKDGSAQVYTMDADGKNQQKVTFGSAAKGSPAFSPDGSMLAYLTQGTLTVYNFETKDDQVLLPPPAGATSNSTASLVDVSRAPVVRYAWSPVPPGSGQQPAIAAVQDSDDASIEALTILSSITAAPKVVAYASTITLAWMPDGSQLEVAIIGGKAGQGQKAFSAILPFTPAGVPMQKQPLALAMSGTYGPYNPAISPDGSQVLFSLLNAPDLAHQQVIGLFAQPSDGSTPPKMAIRGEASHIRWSPDDVHILAIGPEPHSTKHDLWVIATNRSSPPLDLTKGNGNVSTAEWSPTKVKTN